MKTLLTLHSTNSVNHFTIYQKYIVINRLQGKFDTNFVAKKDVFGDKINLSVTGKLKPMQLLNLL